MEAYTVKNLSFRYPETGVDVLKNISFSVGEGEFVAVCGPSGSGKSTLLRQLKPILTPHGISSGEILFEGKNIKAQSLREQSEKIGFVMQSPESQIVTDKVWHELAFGLESLGLPNAAIRKRVAETASFFGIQGYFEKKVTELSGGQKQILNLASAMALQPSVLILDEPTSRLDPIAASEFIHLVGKINRELGTTVIITEHRLDEVLPLADKLLALENGEAAAFGAPQDAAKALKEQKSRIFLSMPAPMKIWASVSGGEDVDCPVTTAQGRSRLMNYAEHHKLFELEEKPKPEAEVSAKPAIELKDVWFRYEKDGADVLKGLSLVVNRGEFAAILGGNGTGKSTALSVIAGINRAYRGKVLLGAASGEHISAHFDTKIALLPQDPQTLFVKKTVLEDLYEMLDGSGLDKAEKRARAEAALKLCRLENLSDRHPYDLSGGEQQRAALAKVLLTRPEILLLDEPTKGIDAEFKAVFAGIIRDLTSAGVTVLMVSHDVEFCAAYTDRCFMFFGGEAVASGEPREFFVSNSFYTTCASKMSKGITPSEAVTDDDVIYSCLGEHRGVDVNLSGSGHGSEFFEDFPSKNPESPKPIKSKKLPLWKKLMGITGGILFIAGLIENLDYIPWFSSQTMPRWFNFLIVGVSVAMLMTAFGSKSKRSVDAPRKSEKLSKRTIAAIISVIFLIPLTIFVGMTYLQDEKYLFISLAVMLECMLPFFMVFEGRHPKTRELVIIAVLCAIGVAGRAAFVMLPQFKPIVAVVIISGVAFGGESGFLVGAVTMLVSNMMLGQGPWTPWQMFSVGVIGLLAGVLFRKGLLGRSRGALCTFGFTAVIIIYGGIMNFYTALTSQIAINFEMILSFYVQGFPMDIVHAVSTVVLLFFGAEPMLEKLDRVKTKYGLIEVE